MKEYKGKNDTGISFEEVKRNMLKDDEFRIEYEELHPMSHRIKSVETKENLIIVATFFNGAIKEYNIKEMFEKYPQLKLLEKDKKLFDEVRIDTGGYGISWNDDLDLAAETIWEDGK